MMTKRNKQGAALLAGLVVGGFTSVAYFDSVRAAFELAGMVAATALVIGATTVGLMMLFDDE